LEIVIETKKKSTTDMALILVHWQIIDTRYFTFIPHPNVLHHRVKKKGECQIGARLDTKKLRPIENEQLNR
jgi:hypothetical protein